MHSPTPTKSLSPSTLFVLFLCSTSASLAVGATSAPPSTHPDVFQPCTTLPDFEGSLQRFSKVLSFKTVSDTAAKDHTGDAAGEFAALNAYLEQAYPQVWSELKVERLGLGNYSTLLTWPGSNPALQPALFISHIDVVPVNADTEPDWVYPPFSGTVAEGFIWGRGTLDVKVGVVGLLEAAAALLKASYQPQRTLLLAFGHDEEVGGAAGAAHIAAKLAAEGQRLAFIWDEGGTILAEGLPPFTHLPVALVATAEKFYQTVEVTLHAPGGHSSMPRSDDMGARVGAFLSAMTASPPPPRLVSPTREFVLGLADLSASPWLAIVSKLGTVLPTGLWNRLIATVFAAVGAPSAALVRDTAAVTMLQAGVAGNVLPQTAQLSINFRLLPGSTAQDALAYVRKWLGPNTAHANLSLKLTPFAPSAVSDDKGPAFQLITQAIQDVWKFSAAAGAQHEGKGVPVLPYLVPGGTDSKHYHYHNLTDTILRFCPFSMKKSDISRIHASNERIGVADVGRLCCTYRTALRLVGRGHSAEGNSQRQRQPSEGASDGAAGEGLATFDEL